MSTTVSPQNYTPAQTTLQLLRRFATMHWVGGDNSQSILPWLPRPLRWFLLFVLLLNSRSFPFVWHREYTPFVSTTTLNISISLKSESFVAQSLACTFMLFSSNFALSCSSIRPQKETRKFKTITIPSVRSQCPRSRYGERHNFTCFPHLASPPELFTKNLHSGTLTYPVQHPTTVTFGYISATQVMPKTLTSLALVSQSNTIQSSSGLSHPLIFLLLLLFPHFSLPLHL